MQTTRDPATVSVTFAAVPVTGDPLAATACGLCGRESIVMLTPSADEGPCCRRCFRARRRVIWR